MEKQLLKDLQNLLDASDRLRKLQKEFFRTKSKDVLNKSIEAEKQYDELLLFLSAKYPRA